MLAFMKRWLRRRRPDVYSVSAELDLLTRERLSQVRRNELGQVRRQPAQSRLLPDQLLENTSR